MMEQQLALFDNLGVTLPLEKWKKGSSTFIYNMSLPVHGWFRFPAGFSAEWAKTLIQQQKALKGQITVLDPFAGVGTTILAAEEAGVVGLGIEAQPFLFRIARAKLLWHTDQDAFAEFAQRVINTAKKLSERATQYMEFKYPKLIQKCFPADILKQLHSLRQAWVRDDTPASELTWLALVSILRACSPVGTAPWQYVLPNKSKKKVVSPFIAFERQVTRMVRDMRLRQQWGVSPLGVMIHDDARSCQEIATGSIDLVVTSPPYPNNYDYADATRLEMTFFGEIEQWADLYQVRKRLVRSCTQHVSSEKLNLDDLLEATVETPIHEELKRVCISLAKERLRRKGRKDYHLMVAAYFADMAQVWRTLRRVCKKGSLLCFVVGDSAPYGFHVPVDKWLGELALWAGFDKYWFEKLRDRNVKWRNRKHKVPLYEGILWVEG